MSGTTSQNQFQVFAGGVNANTLTPANYAALAAVSTGFASGIAQSAQANTVWRQSSTIAAMIGQFIVNNTGQVAGDTGNITTLLSNFTLAVQKASGRQRLTAPLTLFVSTAGADTNNGLSASSPFFSIQAAWNALALGYDLASQQATIKLANGTYTGGLFAAFPLVGQSAGIAVIIEGNPASPASVIINSTTAQVTTIASLYGALISVQDMTINSSGTGQGGQCLVAQFAGTLVFKNIIFGTAVSSHMFCNVGGTLICGGSYTISGSAPIHIACGGGHINYDGVPPFTVTLVGTPNFSTTFCLAQACGDITIFQTTFVGTATGTRYSASSNGVINTGAAGNPNFFPGSVAGAVSSGGVYA